MSAPSSAAKTSETQGNEKRSVTINKKALGAVVVVFIFNPLLSAGVDRSRGRTQGSRFGRPGRLRISCNVFNDPEMSM
jgi:hypothetical protein